MRARHGSVVFVAVGTLLLLPRLAAAQTRGPDLGYSAEMGVCEAITATPLVLSSGFVVGRMLVDSYADEPSGLIRNRAEGEVLVASAGAFGVGFLGCGAAIHLAHGRPARAVASLGLRAALPAVALLLTYALERASNPDDGKDHSAAGLGPALFASLAVPASMGGALAIDHLVLAAPDEPPPSPAARAVYPTLGVARTSTVLGVGGTF